MRHSAEEEENFLQLGSTNILSLLSDVEETQ